MVSLLATREIRACALNLEKGQSIACTAQQGVVYLESHRLLAGASPVLIRVRPSGSRQSVHLGD